jgi:hypothetical protein
MTVFPFQRLTSHAAFAFLGNSRSQAAFNAANESGAHPAAVDRYVTWPSILKFDNDLHSPFGASPDPQFLWMQPTAAGQSIGVAVASRPFTAPEDSDTSFTVYFTAFADNAMEASIELFENVGGTYVYVNPQPAGLGVPLVAGTPEMPATGLFELQPPYAWQDVRHYSTTFRVPANANTYKIVVSLKGLNYLIPAPTLPNPAALRFITDIYAERPAICGQFASDTQSFRTIITSTANIPSVICSGQLFTLNMDTFIRFLCDQQSGGGFTIDEIFVEIVTPDTAALTGNYASNPDLPGPIFVEFISSAQALVNFTNLIYDIQPSPTPVSIIENYVPFFTWELLAASEPHTGPIEIAISVTGQTFIGAGCEGPPHFDGYNLTLSLAAQLVPPTHLCCLP